jgi:hypothetical protein
MPHDARRAQCWKGFRLLLYLEQLSQRKCQPPASKSHLTILDKKKSSDNAAAQISLLRLI